LSVLGEDIVSPTHGTFTHWRTTPSGNLQKYLTTNENKKYFKNQIFD
jgi:hypothetical protein